MVGVRGANRLSVVIGLSTAILELRFYGRARTFDLTVFPAVIAARKALETA